MYRCALTVLGAGSYGTALAMAASSRGQEVCLYARNPDKAAAMQSLRQNPYYLKNLPFPPSLHVTADLKAAVRAAPVLLLVIPSHSFKATLEEIKPLLAPKQALAWATKGLDLQTGKLLSTLAQEILGETMPLAVLSGPTFARELAQGMPTAIALASNDKLLTQTLIALLHTPSFRIYESHDLIGLQLGGAVKNVIAIGAGMSDGLGYGANARTALITRGLAEMIRLGVAMGATERCFMGLSGLGDLILTCTDNQSRNRRFGLLLGQGVAAKDALAQIGQVVEGYTMTDIVYRLGQKLQIKMPICEEIYAVLRQGKSGRAAAQALLSRELTVEE